MTRRVVTGRRDGKGTVLYDGPAPNRKLRKASGLVSTLVWATDESPADISGIADRAERDIGVAPPPLGSVFRVVEFPPDRKEMSRDAVLREMGLSDLSGQKESKHAGMHRTRSVDYAVVMDGEIDMILDDGEVHLAAGDVLVQQGTDHAWVNRGERSCRIAFVLIDARELPA
ncbi:MAG TPA: cupin domain-containing protein [Burkholderiales bacterium]|jgi:mannose-6-phosphate isomerase-like protein (cupin superfamily)|nr:cupin domain-containing protein [Burkholderiales bacterium]